MVVLIQKVVKEGGIKNSGKTGDVIYGQAKGAVDDVYCSILYPKVIFFGLCSDQ